MHLPLHDLIGIPLADLVRAEGRVAEASMEFLRSVGFRPSDDAEHPARDESDLGELRVVTFRYRVQRPGGKEGVGEMRVPLLSLLPIPLLQIARAEMEFAVRIDEAREIEVGTAPLARDSGAPARAAPRRELVGRFDALNPSAGKDDAPRIKIKIEMTQSDLPSGTASLLRNLDKNVSDHDR